MTDLSGKPNNSIFYKIVAILLIVSIIYFAIVYRIELDSRGFELGGLALIIQIPVLIILFSLIEGFVVSYLIGYDTKNRIIYFSTALITGILILFGITFIASGIASNSYGYQSNYSRPFMINVDQTNTRIELRK